MHAIASYTAYTTVSFSTIGRQVITRCGKTVSAGEAASDLVKIRCEGCLEILELWADHAPIEVIEQRVAALCRK